MDDLFRDFRFGLRQMIRRPRTSVLVVLCASLAIGLNATIFSLVNATVLKPPAIAEPGEMVRLFGTYPGFDFASLSYPNFVDLAERQQAFEDMAAFSVLPSNVAIDGRSERLPAVVVTGAYFSTLGVTASRGRVLGPQDDTTRMGHAVAVISDRLWRTRFGADPGVVGREMTINSQPFTVVGVTPAEWKGTFPGVLLDLWIPIQMQPLLQPSSPGTLDSRGSGWLTTLARLPPGVEPGEAQARLDVAVAGLREAFPDQNEDWAVAVHAGTMPLPPAAGRVLEMASLAMMVLVRCVLLIACANVAGLLLARAEERRREIGIRLAIGAGRGRLVRQLLVESVTLAAVGGLLGTGLAMAASRVIPSMLPSLAGLPVVVDVSPDARVYAFTLGLTVATGLLFGLLPALQATRADLVPMMGAGAVPGGGRRRFRLARFGPRHALVGLQVAMSMVLLFTAGLFLGSLDNERKVEIGLDSEGLLIAAMDPSLHGHDTESGLSFFDAVRERVAALPGVESAAWGETVPLALVGNQQRSIDVEGYEPAEGE
ncbi:MAG: ABC transporter permease, partial [Holophagales bacterium]|nr:ABC transporter permease [Holophagales bacterium]